MRREWFEFQVGSPVVIMQEIDWKQMEPIENVSISIPLGFEWLIIAELWKRNELCLIW